MLKRLFDNPVFWRTLLALTLALLVATILIAPSVDLPWTVLTGSFASLTALLFLLTSIIPRASLQSEFRWIALAVAVAPERGPTGRATVLRC